MPTPSAELSEIIVASPLATSHGLTSVPRAPSRQIFYGWVIGQGMMSVFGRTVWARYFGRKHLGKIRGLSLTVAVGASAVGPVIMGVSADYFGAFTDSLWLFAGMSIAAALLSCWASPPRS